MKIITICGSLKFIEEMKYYAEKLEFEGNCVLSIIYPTKDKEKYTPEEIHFLQMAHYKRIDISDEVFVVNKNGYIGEAVKAEIEYANLKHKEIIYLENNIEKEITEIEYGYNFNEIFGIFKDIVYYPTRDNIENILMEYKQNDNRTLYGFFFDKKLIGIIGINNNFENIEVLHFGIHPEYRGKKLGTELMNFIKMKQKTIILSTDDDAIIFYKKYGFKYTEYFSEEYKKIRYDCIYTQ